MGRGFFRFWIRFWIRFWFRFRFRFGFRFGFRFLRTCILNGRNFSCAGRYSNRQMNVLAGDLLRSPAVSTSLDGGGGEAAGRRGGKVVGRRLGGGLLHPGSTSHRNATRRVQHFRTLFDKPARQLAKSPNRYCSLLARGTHRQRRSTERMSLLSHAAE